MIRRPLAERALGSSLDASCSSAGPAVCALTVVCRSASGAYGARRSGRRRPDCASQ